MFKIGEKYRCKKFISNECDIMVKNEYYRVISENKHFVHFLINEKDMVFDITPGHYYTASFWFYNHFYTKKEDRVEKLKRLNNV